jgi:hypothetical protein
MTFPTCLILRDTQALVHILQEREPDASEIISTQHKTLHLFARSEKGNQID